MADVLARVQVRAEASAVSSPLSPAQEDAAAALSRLRWPRLRDFEPAHRPFLVFGGSFLRALLVSDPLVRILRSYAERSVPYILANGTKIDPFFPGMDAKSMARLSLEEYLSHVATVLSRAPAGASWLWAPQSLACDTSSVIHAYRIVLRSHALDADLKCLLSQVSHRLVHGSDSRPPASDVYPNTAYTPGIDPSLSSLFSLSSLSPSVLWKALLSACDDSAPSASRVLNQVATLYRSDYLLLSPDHPLPSLSLIRQHRSNPTSESH